MEKFWTRVDKSGECWLYKGSLTPTGYARVKVNGKTVALHRHVYNKYKGGIPTGLVLDHLCRVRNCVNPEHLEPVTIGENCRRGDTGKHQKVKTHCKYGHEYTEANTKIYRGRRFCIACKTWRDRNRGIPASQQPRE